MAQAVVQAAGDEKQLIAYVAPEVAGLRAWLRERLPAYMVPAKIVALAELPLTANGKVDRSRLSIPEDWNRAGSAKGDDKIDA